MTRCHPSEDVCLTHDEPLISARLCSTGWEKYPIRGCNSLHFCEVCQKDITMAQQYYDGGYGRRAHVECVGTSEVSGS